MPTPQVQNDPIYTLPVLNINGLIVSNDATTPNTKLDISAGTARDTNNVMDIAVGASNANLAGSTIAAPLIIDATTTGANGLDTGSLAASTVYAIYVIADSRYYHTTAAIASLATSSAPQLPFGYDSYRLIGYWATDGSSHFVKAYQTGNGTARTLTYDAAIATAVTVGNSTTYAAVSLALAVPPVVGTVVSIQSNFNPNAAGDVLSMQAYGGVGAQVAIFAPVAGATAHTVEIDNIVIAQLNSGVANFSYKVSAGADAVALFVAGFNYFV